ncbi:MAG: CHASE2 domain-containing protein [Candidatus Omnitrophota bacterium]
MIFPKTIFSKYGAILIGSLFVGLMVFWRVFHAYELISYDLRFKLRPPLAASGDIVIIEISDDTLKNLGLWPLPRDFHASLVDVLREAGVKIIVFDVLFSEPTVYDETFAASIKKQGHVYLPVAFDMQEARGGRLPFPKGGRILADLIPILKSAAAGCGYINVFIDPDGKTRRAPLFIDYNGVLFPSMALKAACDWMGLDVNKAAFYKDKAIIDGALRVPITSQGSLLVNYPGKWAESFKRVSYFEILKAYGDSKRGVSPEFDLSILKDKVCFIGLTATGTSDLRPTPLENIYPMLGLQASVFDSIVHQRYLVGAGAYVNVLINIVIFVLSLLICLKFTPLKALGLVGALGSFYGVAATALFVFCGIWVDMFTPLLFLFLTYVVATAYRFFAEARKRQLLENELDIARTIQENFLPTDIKVPKSLSIAAFIQPAKFVAGDLYDIVARDDKKLGVFIGDVSGKGVPASLIMAQTISLFRIFARQCSDASSVLALLNKELFGKFSGRFVTGLYVIVDGSAQTACVSSAGHAPLLLYKASSHKVSEVELSAGLPLGITDEEAYQDVPFKFEKGDKLVFFTDGLYEARDVKGRDLGLSVVEKAILDNARLSSEEVLTALKDVVLKFAKNAVQHDDITIIVLTNKG